MPSDRDAILKLLRDYAELADTRRFREWAELFAPDGYLEAFGRQFVGREKLERFISKAAQGKHGFEAPALEIDGERARAQCAFRFVSEDPATHSRGIYRDELVRTNGEWLFASRKIEFLARGPAALEP